MRKLIPILLLMCSCEYRIYTCEIEYCTGEVDTIKFESQQNPCNDRPQNWKVAIPEWHGYLNVCRVKHISTHPL